MTRSPIDLAREAMVEADMQPCDRTLIGDLITMGETLLKALREIVEAGTRTETVRIGDAWSENGWQDNEIVSREAEIAAQALAAYRETDQAEP